MYTHACIYNWTVCISTTQVKSSTSSQRIEWLMLLMMMMPLHSVYFLFLVFSLTHNTTAKKHCFIFTWLHTTTLPTTFYDVNSQRKKEKRDKENKKQFFSAAFFLFIFFSRWWRARRPTTKTVEVLGRWVGVVVMTLTSFHFLCSKIHEINCELIFGTRDKRGGEKWDGWESETKKWKQKRQFKTKALYFSVLQQ